MGFKTSLAIAFTLLLIIPFLIKPVNGLYDIGELESLRAYCYLHADRAAQGENVVNDLIKSGLANSTYNDWSCSKISETLESEKKTQLETERKRQLEEATRIKAFAEHCNYGNLTPSQYTECQDAGYKTYGTKCLFEGDREVTQKIILKGMIPAKGLPDAIDLPEIEDINLSRAEPLTPAEQLECVNTDNGPLTEEDKDIED
jgi:hypothetical protein